MSSKPPALLGGVLVATEEIPAATHSAAVIVE
jgi:hypothetical protein